MPPALWLDRPAGGGAKDFSAVAHSLRPLCKQQFAIRADDRDICIKQGNTGTSQFPVDPKAIGRHQRRPGRPLISARRLYMLAAKKCPVLRGCVAGFCRLDNKSDITLG